MSSGVRPRVGEVVISGSSIVASAEGGGKGVFKVT